MTRALGRAIRAIALALMLVTSGGYADPPRRPTSVVPVDALAAQAVTFFEQGRFQEAIPIAERVLREREAALGPHHPEVATSLNDLAEVFVSMGQYERAPPPRAGAAHLGGRPRAPPSQRRH